MRYVPKRSRSLHLVLDPPQAHTWFVARAPAARARGGSQPNRLSVLAGQGKLSSWRSTSSRRWSWCRGGGKSSRPCAKFTCRACETIIQPPAPFPSHRPRPCRVRAAAHDPRREVRPTPRAQHIHQTVHQLAQVDHAGGGWVTRPTGDAEGCYGY